MVRQRMIRRLLYLRNWEIVNIFLLPAYLYFLLTLFNVQDWQSYLFSMFVVCLILAEGAFYWHLKLQIICKQKTALPAYFQPVFSLFNQANLGLLSMNGALIVYSELIGLTDFMPSFWSNALFLFAILEYVNYYHYQLSHDNWNDIRFLIKHKKIRRSPLWVDLQKTKNRSDGIR